MPTGPDKAVKTRSAPERSMAASSAVTSVATGDGCQRPTTSIFIFGRFSCAALTIASVQITFSARIATLGVSFFRSARTWPAMLPSTANSVLPSPGALSGATRNQYLYRSWFFSTLAPSLASAAPQPRKIFL